MFLGDHTIWKIKPTDSNLYFPILKYCVIKLKKGKTIKYLQMCFGSAVLVLRSLLVRKREYAIGAITECPSMRQNPGGTVIIARVGRGTGAVMLKTHVEHILLIYFQN